MKVPINPAALQWALADAALGPRDLAMRTGLSTALVDSWLSGKAQPQMGELAKVGSVLHRSQQFFLRRTLPAGREPSAAQFRKAPGGATGVNSQEIAAVRAAERVQKIAAWAAEQQGDAASPLPAPTNSAGQTANEFRQWLGWQTQQQVNATSKSAAFRALRTAIEGTGCVVLLRNIGEDACRGFSLPHATAPLILVNAAYKLPSLRTYTLLHELAHLSRGEQAICRAAESNVERWCDSFAADFLMPEEHLRQYMLKYIKTQRVAHDDLETVRKISNRYKASWHSVAIRLSELGYANDALVAFVQDPRNKEPQAPGFNPDGGRTAPQIRLDEYGSTYSALLLGAVENEKLPVLEACRHLNLNTDQVRSLSGMLRGI